MWRDMPKSAYKPHFFYCLTVCVMFQSPKVMLLFICPIFLQSCQATCINFCTFLTSVSLLYCPSTSLDPLPFILCGNLTFITARPWLGLRSSLLWCSITLSSQGKHWCQATVMTFWLSVFMWWMRWKCTTAAKRGLALCRAATPQSDPAEAGEGSATKQITLDCDTDASVVVCVTTESYSIWGILRGAVAKWTAWSWLSQHLSSQGNGTHFKNK